MTRAKYGPRLQRRCSYCQRIITIGRETRKLARHLDERGQPCRAAFTTAHHTL